LTPDVVFLSNIDWSAVWQRHQTFAAQWARAGHRVFFVENTGFREPGLRDLRRVASRLRRAAGAKTPGEPLPPGVEIVGPLVLPPTREVFRRLNSAVLAPRVAENLRARGLRPAPLVFAYPPTATTLRLLDLLKPSTTVYDCIDNYAGLPAAPHGLDKTENALIDRADLVLATSRTLAERLRARHANVLELHHGANAAFFLPPRPPGPHRRLVYFGTLWRALDYAPIAALAEAGFDVALIGPEKESPPTLPAAVRRPGPAPRSALPGLLAKADALLLPYVDDEYNRGVIPAKTYECLATGLPVLASPLPALTSLPELSVLRFARSPTEWVASARALDAEETPDAREARVAVARMRSEESAFAALKSAVEAARTRP
jgi:glycosyltransferase involved in cell wall biosynthesis